jgi:cytochrome c2
MHAAKEGFNYSAANRALAGKPWGYEELNAFIAAPARAMPGRRRHGAARADAHHCRALEGARACCAARSCHTPYQ